MTVDAIVGSLWDSHLDFAGGFKHFCTFQLSPYIIASLSHTLIFFI